MEEAEEGKAAEVSVRGDLMRLPADCDCECDGFETGVTCGLLDLSLLKLVGVKLLFPGLLLLALQVGKGALLGGWSARDSDKLTRALSGGGVAVAAAAAAVFMLDEEALGPRRGRPGWLLLLFCIGPRGRRAPSSAGKGRIHRSERPAVCGRCWSLVATYVQVIRVLSACNLFSLVNERVVRYSASLPFKSPKAQDV